MVRKLKTREVVRMCQDGRAGDARKLLLGLLSATSGDSKAEQRRLLDDLLHVELHAGRSHAALQVLERRRVLGYRKVEQRMDAALHAATLLDKVGRFVDARGELIGIIRDRRSLHWDGLLPALSLYVELDGKCRELMNPVLLEASGMVIKKFGIPISIDVVPARLSKTIKAVHKLFRGDSKTYSGLLSRVFTESTPAGRLRLVDELRQFSENARVEFFKNQATQLLSKLMSKINR